MSMSIEIEGMKALDSALSEFPKKFANKAVKKAIKAGMGLVLRDAKRLTPVDSGLLARSLKIRVAKGRKGKRLPRGVIGFQVESVKTKRTDAYYAGFVFLGAKNRDGTRRPGTRTLRRALYNNAAAVRAVVIGELKSDLPRVAREVKLDSLRYKG